MTTDVEELSGIEMSRDEIDRFLSSHGYGVLSLARDGRSYSVPVSFGFGGDRLYLYLIRFGEESEKLSFVESTEEAALLCFDVESRFEWRSVLARGPISPITDADRDRMEAVMDQNAWMPSLFPGSEPMTGVERMELRFASVTGRKAESR